MDGISAKFFFSRMTKTFGKKRSMDGDGSIHRFKRPLKLPKTLAFPICKLNRRNKESALFLLFFNWYLIHLHTCIELLPKKKILVKFTQKTAASPFSLLRRMSTVSNAIIPQTSSSKSPFVMILKYNVYPFSYENLKQQHSLIYFSSPLSSS